MIADANDSNVQYWSMMLLPGFEGRCEKVVCRANVDDTMKITRHLRGGGVCGVL